MTDDIKLPPLPYPQIPGDDYTSRDMWDYARAAIKYDRQQRGEPVGELEPTFPAGNSNMLGGVYKLGFFSGQGIPVYTGPQAACRDGESSSQCRSSSSTRNRT